MKYHIHTDIMYPPLDIIDVPDLADNCKDKWYNQTLTKVNDSVVRLGIIEGEFHWHKHDQDDEFFYVLEGELFLEVDDGKKMTYVLKKHQGITIPKGVLHRPWCTHKVIMLMVETNQIRPEGD